MAAPPKPSPTLVTKSPGRPAGEENLSVVETPTSPSSAFALSRFEFETGKGNEGTKILMVEWDSTAAAGTGTSGREGHSDWEVSWEGKTSMLCIRDADADSGANKRVFFLLPPGATVPPLVTISQRSANSVLRTKPMPAIFPAGLGSSDKEAGKRGVLHTIWAKKRLSELEAEIAEEMKANSESIGLEMAIQEREWIKDHFGVGEPSGQARKPYPMSPQSPISPRSPIGGRLGEKLRGLKLATSPVELAAATQASKPKPNTSLSPQAADVAVSSYSTFPGRAGSKMAGESAVASLDAVVDSAALAKPGTQEAHDTEEELFALPMSPRSPEMKRSPFSLL